MGDWDGHLIMNGGGLAQDGDREKEERRHDCMKEVQMWGSADGCRAVRDGAIVVLGPKVSLFPHILRLWAPMEPCGRSPLVLFCVILLDFFPLDFT
jgi:hypothetical protein